MGALGSNFGSFWEPFGKFCKHFERILICFEKTKSMFPGGWVDGGESHFKDYGPHSKRKRMKREREREREREIREKKTKE